MVYNLQAFESKDKKQTFSMILDMDDYNVFISSITDIIKLVSNSNDIAPQLKKDYWTRYSNTRNILLRNSIFEKEEAQVQISLTTEELSTVLESFVLSYPGKVKNYYLEAIGLND